MIIVLQILFLFDKLVFHQVLQIINIWLEKGLKPIQLRTPTNCLFVRINIHRRTVWGLYIWHLFYILTTWTVCRRGPLFTIFFKKWLILSRL